MHLLEVLLHLGPCVLQQVRLTLERQHRDVSRTETYEEIREAWNVTRMQHVEKQELVVSYCQ